jgi:D-amino-acid dehydrogenase
MTKDREPESVVVVGGGLIGLCCAYFLRQQGLDVTVVESGAVGGGSSRGNCGMIVPDLVAPLSTPGIIRDSLRSFLNPNSALFVHPQVSFELLRYLRRFTLSTRPQAFERAVEELQTFAQDSFALFEMMESDGVTLDRNAEGFLYVFSTQDAAAKTLRAQSALTGLRADLLTGDQIRALEPTMSDRVEAGFALGDQWAIDPSEFVDNLAASLRASSVSIIESARATSIGANGDSAWVHTSSGTFSADTCVVAAGVWSRDLCRTLGVDLDIVAGKGYSFNLDVPHGMTHTTQFADVHIVATPMGKDVRIAGTMELDRRREHFNHGRIRSIVAAVDPYLADVDWKTTRNEWMGARPMTGDGMPIIGRIGGPSSRVLVAAGHNMYGLTLGPVTGRMVAQIITEPSGPGPINPFDPSNNGRARRWRR